MVYLFSQFKLLQFYFLLTNLQMKLFFFYLQLQYLLKARTAVKSSRLALINSENTRNHPTAGGKNGSALRATSSVELQLLPWTMSLLALLTNINTKSNIYISTRQLHFCVERQLHFCIKESIKNYTGKLIFQKLTSY